MRLEDGFFERFLAIFGDFGLILGGPGEAWELPKIIKNAKKSNLGVFGRYLGSEGGFGVTFGRHLGGFWMKFGRIFVGFRACFGSDLRSKSFRFLRNLDRNH